MNDIEAVKKLKEGDRLGFKYLFTKYYDQLVAYIIMYTNNKSQAEDIVQLAFINFWDARLKLKDDESPRNYLYSIAHNRYVDTVKKSKKQRKLVDRIKEKALRNQIQEDTEAVEKRVKKMKEVMESLPPKCKEILYMNKVQGFKYKEISEQLGVSVKTVESQMYIAFKKIRKAFKESNFVLFHIFKKQ